MPKVHFINEIVTVEAPRGATIDEVARLAGITLYRGLWTWAHCSRLGLRGLCGSCQVWTQGAVSPKSLLERWKPSVRGQIRLGCLARVEGDCEVRTQPGGPPVVQTTRWDEDPRPSRWKDRLTAADEADDDDGAKPAKPAAAAAPPAATDK
jgi:ferredoxin